MGNVFLRFLVYLILTQMGAHQTFPEPPVIWHGEMEQFVDDDVVLQLYVESEQFVVKIQVAGGGTGSPFVAHGANTQPDDLHIQFVGPIADASLESLFLIDGRHRFRFDLRFQAG